MSSYLDTSRCIFFQENLPEQLLSLLKQNVPVVIVLDNYCHISQSPEFMVTKKSLNKT